MRRVYLVLMVLSVASTALAQTVVNPRTATFPPSADHSATLSDGRATVTRYELRWFAQGASSPMLTTDLGKPTPVNNSIVVDLLTLKVLASFPLGAGYTGKVVAIGPTGEGVSPASNPFDVVAPPRAPTSVILGGGS